MASNKTLITTTIKMVIVIKLSSPDHKKVKIISEDKQ